MLIEDVIIAVPEYAKESVASYCQAINTKAWEEYGKRLSEPAIKQGWRLIGQGLKLAGQDLYVQMRRLASNIMGSVIQR